MDIASREYQKLERAYTKFNKSLFYNELPPCFFTYQRKTRALGLFVFESFQEKNSQESISEISLNPDYFLEREDRKILSDLAHEMVHVWQAYCGTPSRSGYHNREWAEKMEKIGLMPSATGQPGGARTGQKMSDYIIKNHHMFYHHAQTLLNRGFSISWASIIGEIKKSSARSSQAQAKNKIKYTCPECAANVWGKPGLYLLCLNCDLPFEVKGIAA
jgi:predicted SprT family Zn-dependent metalloprotease